MTTRQTFLGAVTLAAAVAFAPAAFAQAQGPASAEPRRIEGVTVMAPRITYEVSRAGGEGVPLSVEMTKASSLVSLKDLDLNRTADLFVVQERIESAAKRVCTELVEKYPRGQPEQDVCERRAIEDAMAQVRQMTQEAVARR